MDSKIHLITLPFLLKGNIHRILETRTRPLWGPLFSPAQNTRPLLGRATPPPAPRVASVLAARPLRALSQEPITKRFPHEHINALGLAFSSACFSTSTLLFS